MIVDEEENETEHNEKYVGQVDDRGSAPTEMKRKRCVNNISMVYSLRLPITKVEEYQSVEDDPDALSCQDIVPVL